jgi:hypothetical protein
MRTLLFSPDMLVVAALAAPLCARVRDHTQRNTSHTYERNVPHSHPVH